MVRGAVLGNRGFCSRYKSTCMTLPAQSPWREKRLEGRNSRGTRSRGFAQYRLEIRLLSLVALLESLTTHIL
jgi:hypothetical protein